MTLNNMLIQKLENLDQSYLDSGRGAGSPTNFSITGLGSELNSHRSSVISEPKRLNSARPRHTDIRKVFLKSPEKK